MEALTACPVRTEFPLTTDPFKYRLLEIVGVYGGALRSMANEMALRASADGYEFRVSDNGVGMPADDRDRVLDLFYRAAPARAAGLGVGLAVVKLLVEQSGGTLTIDSGAGQGTTLVAVLPRYHVDDYLT